MKSKLAVILIMLFGGMLMVGVSDGVYASDQAYYYSKPVSVKDTLTGLLVYEDPEIEAQYLVRDEFHHTFSMLLSEVTKNHSFDLINGYRYCVQFVVTTEGKVVGPRPRPLKGIGINEFSRCIADYINSKPEVISKWRPAKVGGKNVNQIKTLSGQVCLQGLP